MPEVFNWLQQNGNVAHEEMHRTFNCGVGMVICVAQSDVSAAVEQLKLAGHEAWKIGQITPCEENIENEVELLP